ncbi:glycosyl transferase family 1 [Microbacterium sp. AG157]|uniref:glycosyltransferase n=1 Tax=Microbacterium sp. AG157 TaxID=2183993 RepID=UPI000E22CD5F|nr:glycosyltransferase [Microbacterium sp. AG157]REC97324.1 glycosyl transferase family 1 [Microbacterium sp. AG157]
MTRTVTVGFPAVWDIAEWETSHANGERPDRWPYGLDRLDDQYDLRTVALSSRGYLPQFQSRRSQRRGVAIGWEESSVARLVASRRFEHVVGGVIWNTDPPVNARDRAVKALYRRALKQASALWCLSRPQVALVEAILGRDRPAVHFLKFGIDTDYYRPAPLPLQPLVLSAGGDRDRDIPTLYAAMAEIKAARPDTQVVVQTASDHPVPAGIVRVQRLSHRDLRDLYGRASIVAIATRFNHHVSGMTVALEAAATGRPVVTTDTPGMSDYVDEASGRLTPAGDAGAMAAAVVGLLDSPRQLRDLGRAGQHRVLTSHSTKTMSSAIGEIVASLSH